MTALLLLQAGCRVLQAGCRVLEHCKDRSDAVRRVSRSQQSNRQCNSQVGEQTGPIASTFAKSLASAGKTLAIIIESRVLRGEGSANNGRPTTSASETGLRPRGPPHRRGRRTRRSRSRARLPRGTRCRTGAGAAATPRAPPTLGGVSPDPTPTTRGARRPAGGALPFSSSSSFGTAGRRARCRRCGSPAAARP